MRDAGLARPAMYFGSEPPSGWPLVRLGWTVTDLLSIAPPDDQQVEVTVHTDGRFTARVRAAAFGWPRRAASPEEAMRMRQWWTQLGRTTSYTIEPTGPTRDDQPVDQHGLTILSNVDVAITVECDPDLVGPGPRDWWRAWLDRREAVVPDVPWMGCPGPRQRGRSSR